VAETRSDALNGWFKTRQLVISKPNGGTTVSYKPHVVDKNEKMELLDLENLASLASCYGGAKTIHNIFGRLSCSTKREKEIRSQSAFINQCQASRVVTHTLRPTSYMFNQVWETPIETPCSGHHDRACEGRPPSVIPQPGPFYHCCS
jgi:hypothetical protein